MPTSHLRVLIVTQEIKLRIHNNRNILLLLLLLNINVCKDVPPAALATELQLVHHSPFGRLFSILPREVDNVVS